MSASGDGLPSPVDLDSWGIDPAWSRRIDVPSHDGGTHGWHLLDTGTPDPQALVLLNSEFSFACARDLAKCVQEHAVSDQRAQVDLAYRRTLGRPPTEGESERAVKILAERAAVVEETALAQLCLALFSLNEFIYVD